MSGTEGRGASRVRRPGAASGPTARSATSRDRGPPGRRGPSGAAGRARGARRPTGPGAGAAALRVRGERDRYVARHAGPAPTLRPVPEAASRPGIQAE